MTHQTIGGPAAPADMPGPTGERVVYVVGPQAASHQSGESIDLIELWRIVWGGKLTIVAITAVFAIAAVAYAVLATPWFRAQTLLMAAEEQSTPGLMSQFGSLVGLAGISVGSSDTAEPLAVLQSQGFTRGFIESESLITVLLADDWDAANETWKEMDPDEQPDWRNAAGYFEEEVRGVAQDSSTGLITLSINWTDPQVAADWANKLIARLNDSMREKALVEAEANVAYLQAQLAATNIVTVQQAVGSLLESEMQKLMIARGKEEFALRVIDRAEAPREPSKPQRLLVVFLSTLAGGMFAVLFVIFRRAVQMRQESQT